MGSPSVFLVNTSIPPARSPQGALGKSTNPIPQRLPVKGWEAATDDAVISQQPLVLWVEFIASICVSRFCHACDTHVTYAGTCQYSVSLGVLKGRAEPAGPQLPSRPVAHWPCWAAMGAEEADFEAPSSWTPSLSHHHTCFQITASESSGTPASPPSSLQVCSHCWFPSAEPARNPRARKGGSPPRIRSLRFPPDPHPSAANQRSVWIECDPITKMQMHAGY